jgi:hypothetical protein
MFFRSMRLKWVARRYARTLPPWLANAYGKKVSYSEAQLRSAVAKTGLDARFIGIAFSAYLQKPEFEALKSSLPVPMDYEAVRELFVSSTPVNVVSADGFLPPKNGDAILGAGDSHN